MPHLLKSASINRKWQSSHREEISQQRQIYNTYQPSTTAELFQCDPITPVVSPTQVGFVPSSQHQHYEDRRGGERWSKTRERWDIRRVCQATRTSSLPPSADLHVLYCAGVSHVYCPAQKPFSLFWGISRQISSLQHYSSLPPKETQREAERQAETAVNETPSTPKLG